ncbi:MAG: type II toxin-antitoxin system RelE/ParE family toxin [Lysobacterales bacterium]
MTFEVEYTDEFGDWWEHELDEAVQDEVLAVVGLLEIEGPHLGFPYSSGIRTSKFSHMRELRIQYKGEPYRIFYAFNPLRHAILLFGGNKGGNDRYYDRYVPMADALYEEHLAELEKEGTL